MKSFIASTIFLSIFFSQGLFALDFPANFSLHNKAKEKIWVEVRNSGFNQKSILVGNKEIIGSPGSDARKAFNYSIDGQSNLGSVVAVPIDRYYATAIDTNQPTIVRLFNNSKELLAEIKFRDNITTDRRTIHISYDPSASPKVYPQRGAWLGLKSTTVLGYDLDNNVKDAQIIQKYYK